MRNHLRSIIALSLTAVLCYLAISGHDAAQTALKDAFLVLVAWLFAERTALKVPGKDGTE